MKHNHWPYKKAICLTPHAVFMPVGGEDDCTILLCCFYKMPECHRWMHVLWFSSPLQVDFFFLKKKKTHHNRILERFFPPQLHSYKAYSQEKTLTPNALHIVFSQVLKATPLVWADERNQFNLCDIQSVVVTDKWKSIPLSLKEIMAMLEWNIKPNSRY